MAARKKKKKKKKKKGQYQRCRTTRKGPYEPPPSTEGRKPETVGIQKMRKRSIERTKIAYLATLDDHEFSAIEGDLVDG